MKSHSEILRTGTSTYSTYTFLRDTFSPKQQEIHMRWEVLWHLQKCIMLLYVQWSNKKHVIFGSGFHLVFRIWLGFRAKENCANSNFTKDLSTETWFNPLCFSHCPVKHQCSPNTHLDSEATFFSSQSLTLLGHPIWFSFSEASYLARFSKLSFWEIFLWTMTEVWLLLVTLRSVFLIEMSARWFTLAFIESSLECPGILIIKVAGESIAFNNFQAQGPFLIVFPVEVRKPHYFHNISKSWAIQKHIYYQY